MIFKNVNEAILAYENRSRTLHSRIKVRVTKTMPDGTVKSGIIESTMGRFIFNEIIPQDLGFVDRSIPGNELKLEVTSMCQEAAKADPGEGYQRPRRNPDRRDPGRYQGHRL